jgi:serine protease Do
MKNFFQRNTSIFTFVLAAFLGGLAFSAGSSLFHPSNAKADGAPKVMTPEDLGNAFSAVADAATPAVVQITTTEKIQVQNNPLQQFFRMNPFGNDPRENDQGDGEEGFQQGLGSGVIIRENGYIVTNNHVVDGATTVDVKLTDGRSMKAKIVGKDKANDLAVIKIEANNLPTIQFGDVNTIKVGQWVVAIGSPFSVDLGNTVTAGIVSAMGRSNPSERNSLTNYIQTDAAINPGNSGGPLLNLQGKLVGINSAIKSNSGGFEGIGFSIPVDIVQNIAEQLMTGGSVKRGMLGVNIQQISPSLARALNAPSGGARVASFRDGSPAQRAGVQEDDIIVGVDGHKLQNSAQLPSLIANKQPNSIVQLTILRDGREITIPVKLVERTEDQASNVDESSDDAFDGTAKPQAESKQSIDGLGFSVKNITSQFRQQAKLGDQIQGVLVMDVTPSSAIARESNIGNGTIITGIGNTRQNSASGTVKSVNDFMSKYNALHSGESMFIRGVQLTQGGSQNPFLTAITKP